MKIPTPDQAAHCGLNADWCNRAWFFGGGRGRPNQLPGGVYVFEEDSGEGYSVIRRSMGPDEQWVDDRLLENASWEEAYNAALVECHTGQLSSER